jgi:hypothetical protein
MKWGNVKFKTNNTGMNSLHLVMNTMRSLEIIYMEKKTDLVKKTQVGVFCYRTQRINK